MEKEIFNQTLSYSFFSSLFVNLAHFVIRILICIIFYYICLKILKIIAPIFKKKWSITIFDESFRTFIRSLVYVLAHIIIIMICLEIIGFKESSLIAFFGTLGIGIGLALKDNLANFAGGIIILIFKIYKVGDEVWVDGLSGFVDSIDVFSTNIKAHNGDLIVIPNGLIVGEKIINYDKTPFRRIKIIVTVDYSTDIVKTRKILEELMNSNPLVLKEPAVSSNVEEYADSSINIAIKGWTSNNHYWTVYHEIMNELKATLDKNNISIPFPQMDVHMNVINKKEEN